MKATLIAPAFVGTAFTAVTAQDPNGACSPNSNSTAPAPLVNTLAGFNEWTGYSVMALETRVPTGYETTLANGNCAVSSSKYMLYSKLETYDVQACADICDVHRGCDAFNIYVQREPSMTPGTGCPNPKAIFTTICALYSEPVSLSNCSNLGQFMGPEDANGEAFKTAIRASNIYARLPAKDAAKVITTTRNVFYDKPSPLIQTPHPSETTTTRVIDIVISKATSLQSMTTAIPTPLSVVDNIDATVKKLVSAKVIVPTISAAASPLSVPAAVISVPSPAQQANTILSQPILLQPAPITVLPSMITEAPSVKKVVAATIEVANTTSTSTTVSAAVLLGTPFAKQVDASSSEAVNTPALAFILPSTPVVVLPSTPVAKQAETSSSAAVHATALIASLIDVAPGTPSANLVNASTAIQRSELTTLATAIISQIPSIAQAATLIVDQFSASTATPTILVVKTPSPVLRRWNWTGERRGYLNHP